MKNLSHPCKNTCSGWQQGYEEAMSDFNISNQVGVDPKIIGKLPSNKNSLPPPKDNSGELLFAMNKILELADVNSEIYNIALNALQKYGGWKK